MKNTVVNMRRLLIHINDMQARSNLMWDSAMAENGILKCGRLTDFQAHQIEHQLGTYTDCNHGQGLAVIHPVYYRHIVKDARVRSEYQADAWLYGTVTTKEFTQGRKPELEPSAEVPAGDFIAPNHAPLYYISIDTQGEIGWESGTFCKSGRPDAHVIEVLTECTSPAYRAYLRERGVSYIIAGSELLDSRIAAGKLHRLFGINTLLICGGGTINWTFLQQGVVDELSLLMAPVADGNPDSVTVFEKSDFLPACMPVEFHLKNAERLKGDGVWLIYTVNNRE